MSLIDCKNYAKFNKVSLIWFDSMKWLEEASIHQYRIQYRSQYRSQYLYSISIISINLLN